MGCSGCVDLSNLPRFFCYTCSLEVSGTNLSRKEIDDLENLHKNCSTNEDGWLKVNIKGGWEGR